MSEWVSVDEQMPQLDDHVLYYMSEYDISGCGIVCDASYKQGQPRRLYLFDGDRDLSFDENNITHWMNFPRLPK